MRTLVIILALLLAFTIIKRLINNRSRSKTMDGKTTSDGQKNSAQPETLAYKDTVQCGYCGTHIPSASAYKAGDKHYCDEAHSREKEN